MQIESTESTCSRTMNFSNEDSDIQQIHRVWSANLLQNGRHDLIEIKNTVNFQQVAASLTNNKLDDITAQIIKDTTTGLLSWEEGFSRYIQHYCSLTSTPVLLSEAEDEDNGTIESDVFSDDLPPIDHRTSSTDGSNNTSTALVVDDSKVFRQITSKMLQNAGYHVDVAEDGAIGLEKMKATQYDLVVMDLQMPVMDGFEAARNIRVFETEVLEREREWEEGEKERRGRWAQFIVGVSSDGSETVRQEALRSGMDCFCPKPISYQDLSVLITSQYCNRAHLDATSSSTILLNSALTSESIPSPLSSSNNTEIATSTSSSSSDTEITTSTSSSSSSANTFNGSSEILSTTEKKLSKKNFLFSNVDWSKSKTDDNNDRYTLQSLVIPDEDPLPQVSTSDSSLSPLITSQTTLLECLEEKDILHEQSMISLSAESSPVNRRIFARSSSDVSNLSMSSESFPVNRKVFPRSLSDRSGTSRSSIRSTTSDVTGIRKVFTEIHNTTVENTSPYLGEDTSAYAGKSFSNILFESQQSERKRIQALNSELSIQTDNLEETCEGPKTPAEKGLRYSSLKRSNSVGDTDFESIQNIKPKKKHSFSFALKAKTTSPCFLPMPCYEVLLREDTVVDLSLLLQSIPVDAWITPYIITASIFLAEQNTIKKKIDSIKTEDMKAEENMRRSTSTSDLIRTRASESKNFNFKNLNPFRKKNKKKESKELDREEDDYGQFSDMYDVSSLSQKDDLDSSYSDRRLENYLRKKESAINPPRGVKKIVEDTKLQRRHSISLDSSSAAEFLVKSSVGVIETESPEPCDTSLLNAPAFSSNSFLHSNCHSLGTLFVCRNYTPPILSEVDDDEAPGNSSTCNLWEERQCFLWDNCLFELIPGSDTRPVGFANLSEALISKLEFGDPQYTIMYLSSGDYDDVEEYSSDIPRARSRASSFSYSSVSSPVRKLTDLDFEPATVISLSFLVSSAADAGRQTVTLCSSSPHKTSSLLNILVEAQVTVADMYDYNKENESFPDLGTGRYSKCFKAINKRTRRTQAELLEDEDSAATAAASISITSNCNSDNNVAMKKRKKRFFSFKNNHTNKSTSREKLLSTTGEESDTLLPLLGECALKVVNKRQYWERVRNGKERGDSLSREVLCQAHILNMVNSSFQANSQSSGQLTAVANETGLTNAEESLQDQAGRQRAELPVVHLYGVLETRDNFVIEMELMQSINLAEKLKELGEFTEEQAKYVALQLVQAVSLCQLNGLAHRDIKLTNITFPVSHRSAYLQSSSQSANKSIMSPLQIKLADFGMAGFVDKDGKLRGRCGTPGYAAPEILKSGKHESYDMNVDMFSVGCVVYTLLCGYEPFFGENEEELIQANKSANYAFHLPEWGKISEDAKDFVNKLLNPFPTKRLTVREALDHPWLAIYGGTVNYPPKFASNHHHPGCSIS